MSIGNLPCPEHPGKTFRECQDLHVDERFAKMTVPVVETSVAMNPCPHLLREYAEDPEVVIDLARGPMEHYYWTCPDCNSKWTTRMPHR